MSRKHPIRGFRHQKETGTAMLIAIFALLLISVVGIALVISSGTNSSLAGNYRTATSAYYAGMAGLEEARGRLLWKNPDYINITNSFSNLMSSSGIPTWSLNQVLYITNPGPGETVDPTSANPADYPDTEYSQEFSWGLGGAVVQQIPSVSEVAGLPGPSYKWVRINAVTEAALNSNFDGYTGRQNNTLFYDQAFLNASGQPAPGLLSSSSPATPPQQPTPTAVQVLEVTALAVAPNGGHRLLQYLVVPLIISPDSQDQSFPAALTLDGNRVTYQSPGTAAYSIAFSSTTSCNPPYPIRPNTVYSIAYTNPADHSSILSEVNPTTSYSGASSPTYAPANTGLLPSPPPPPAAPPGFTSGLLRTNWQTPAGLDSVMQDIVNSADVVMTGPATGANISNRAPMMSASNPMTIVVNGDLNLYGWRNTGYGLLLVTGTLSYDPDANWVGIILVVGQGVFVSNQAGTGGISGAVLVAKTRNAAGNLLAGNSLGAASFTSTGSHPGTGISYCSSAIGTAQGPLSYKVLSFREVPLPN